MNEFNNEDIERLPRGGREADTTEIRSNRRTIELTTI